MALLLVEHLKRNVNDFLYLKGDFSVDIHTKFRFERIHLWIAVFFVLVICVVYGFGRGLIKNQPYRSADTKSNARMQPLQINEGGAQVAFPSPVIADKSNFPVLSGFSPAEMSDIGVWFAAHGNFMFESDAGQYASYNMETLQRLCESGDIRAFHALAKLYLSKENSRTYGFDAAVPIYWSAAAYGSTQALIELGIIIDAKYRFGLHSSEEKQQANLEVFSLYEAAALRGDKWGELVYGKSMMSSSSISLSESDKAFINKRSQEIYVQIQQKRYELGLGKFDNGIPDVVSRFYKEIGSLSKN